MAYQEPRLVSLERVSDAAAGAGLALSGLVRARLWLAAQLLLPLLLAVTVYWPYLDDYFALDDLVWLRAVDRGWLDVIRRSVEVPPFTPYDAPTPFFRPLADLVFKLQTAVFGQHPAGYHAVNIGFHSTTAALGGLLIARITRQRVLGIVVSLLFVCVPAYDIAVTWISQLSELMGACFAAATLLTYHAYLTARDARRVRLFLPLSFVFLALGALSKESQVTAFALLPLLALAVPDRARSAREIAIGLVVGASMLTAYLLFAYFHELSDAADAYDYSLGTHVPDRFLYYVRWLVLPFGEPDKGALRTVLAVGYLAMGAFAVASGRRAAGFFFAWSVLAILPFSLFRTVIQTRYTYLAVLPFLGFLAVMLSEASSHIPAGWRRPAAVAGVATLVTLAAVMSRETRDNQRFLVAQSEEYEALYAAIRTQCSDTAPGGTIYVEGSGVLNAYNVIVSPGANIFLDRVDVRVSTPPAGAETLDNVCIAHVR